MLRAAVVFLVLGTLCVPQAFAVNTVIPKVRPIPVGGQYGIWAEGVADYTAWAMSLKTTDGVPEIPTGTLLLFNFSAPYDVVEVPSQAELDTCNLRYAKLLKPYVSPGVPQVSLLALSNPGYQYITTTAPGACGNGVKFAIKVGVSDLQLEHYYVGGAETGGLWAGNSIENKLQKWADTITVQQGDILEFVIPIHASTMHSVVEVPTQDELDRCDFSRATTLLPAAKSSEGAIVRFYYRLSRTGLHHFVCDTPNHCDRFNHKFSVNVDSHPIRGFNMHWVGGEANDNLWTPTGSDYEGWADALQVHWTDQLVFRSPKDNRHGVKVLPTRDAFDQCDFSGASLENVSPPSLVGNVSAITVSAVVPGKLYLANPEHCDDGMKIAVTVGEIPILSVLDVDLIGGGNELADLNLGSSSTTLGNLIADSFAHAGNFLSPVPVRFGICNSGAIGPGIPKGPFSGVSALQIFPYPNTLVVKMLSGAEIKSLFDVSARAFTQYEFLQISSSFLVTQGVVPGEGIVVHRVQYYDEFGTLHDFNDDEYYAVATNDYVGAGGDGYWMFEGKPDLLDNEALNVYELQVLDIFAIGYLGRDPAVPISPLDTRYITLGVFLAASAFAPVWEAKGIARYPEYKRDILHAVKEYKYADGDPSFFSANLSEVTPDDGKGQRFYSALDDSLNALASVRLPDGSINPDALGLMWSTLQKFYGFTRIALDKATAEGCNEEDDMNIAWDKFDTGLSRVVDRPEDVLDKWREAYRISTECTLRGPRRPRRTVVQQGRKLRL
eukprot:jgi/Mesvir1/15535/Mv03185-RA.1